MIISIHNNEIPGTSAGCSYYEQTFDKLVKSSESGWIRKKLHMRGARKSNHFCSNEADEEFLRRHQPLAIRKELFDAHHFPYYNSVLC